MMLTMLKPNDVEAIRSSLRAAGYPPVPVETAGKKPVGFAWNKAAKVGKAVAANGTALNTGILCDGLRVIDIDIDDAELAQEVANLARDLLGEAPERYRDNSGRRTLVYRAAEGEPSKRSVKGRLGAIEVLGQGQQFVAFGKHPSGTDLKWRHKPIYEVPRDTIPAITEEELTAFLDAASTVVEAEGRQETAPEFSPRTETRRDGRSVEEIEDLLSWIDPGVGYDEWIKVIMAIHAETGGSQEGFSLADEWSSRGANYRGTKDVASHWKSFGKSGVTGATIAKLARENGADLSEIARKHGAVETPYFDPVEKAEAARRLIERHDGVLADAETGEIVEMASELPTPSLDYPAGLVGDIAKWIVATSRRQQPELAIGAALAIVGTVAGRQFAGPTLSGTHLYILGLAPTGKGKDHGLQQIGRIMAAANMGIHLGPSEFISMPAVVNFLVRKPLSLCAMDEFGGFMKRINSKRASGFESSISKILRTMWSSSFAPYQTPEWAQKESQTIFAPSMTLYGASTPEQFYGSMESASLEDGTLNRFLIMRGRDKAPEREPEMEAAKVPEWIVHGLKRIYFASGEMAATWRNDAGVDPAAHDAVKILPWCPDGAEERYREFSHEIERRIEQEPDAAAFHARAVEMAIRVATIVAIGRMEDMAVRKADLEFGIEVAMASARIMVEGAADYMAENENQANAQKIMRIVKGRGGRVKYRDIVVGMKHTMKSRDLRDMLAFMVEAGQLERQEVKQEGGRWPIIWYSKP